MRIGDALLFAPGIPFGELDLDDVDGTVAAFERRVEGFYLEPARRFAADKDHAFACGLLCCAAIDFLARYLRPEREPEARFIAWLRAYVPAFLPENHAKRFYVDFRHGLVHEGRVKNAGQFSFDFPDKVILCEDQVMTVNPALLVDAIA